MKFAKVYLFLVLVASLSYPFQSSGASSKCSGLFAVSANSAKDLIAERQDQLFTRQIGEKELSRLILQIDKLAREDKFVKQAQEMLLDEKLELIIFSHTSPSKVHHEGLLNIHSESSASVRDFIEAAALQMRPLEYSRFNPKLKPKYGILAPKGMKIESPGYGQYAYRVNLQKVRDTLTFALAGDSRNRIQSDHLLPWNFNSEFQLTEKNDSILKLENWTYLFIPWKYRVLLSNSLAKMLRNGIAKLDETFQDSFYPNVQRSREYIEVQIFGEVPSSFLSEI